MLLRILNSYEIINQYFHWRGEKEFLHTRPIRHFNEEKNQLWVKQVIMGTAWTFTFDRDRTI